MKRKIFYETLLAFLALLLTLVPATALAQEEEPSFEEGSDGYVEIGGWDSSTKGSPDIAAEYEPTGGGADVALDIANWQGWGSLLVRGHFLDGDDQEYELDFDVQRSVRSHTSYLKLLHRMVKDPLTNLEAATNHGRVVWHSDLDPDDEYRITYSDLEHRTEVQPVEADWLTFGLNYRRQERRGIKQALVISHCDTCHVNSQSRPIDEQTEDAGLDAVFDFEFGQVHASFVHREFRDDAPGLTLLFDDALQPELLVPVFDNRMQYDSAQGPQPVHRTPDIQKDIGQLGVVWYTLGGTTFNFNSVYARTENEFTGLESDYRAYLVNAVRRHKAWRFRLRGQYYTIDNDEVFVDVVEPVGIAGPQAGRTFREIYGFDPDFLRLSALDRDVAELRFDASYKLGKKSGTVKFLWELENIDRENFVVAPGEETETTENIFGVTWSARPKKGTRVHAALRHGDVDNPFMALNAGASQLFSENAPNPFAPNSAQYFEFQNARIADLTAAPEDWNEFKAGYSFVKDKKTFSASYRYWDGENDSLDLTDWSRTNQALNISLWVAPEETWQWHVGYAWHDSEVDLPASIPIFDG